MHDFLTWVAKAWWLGFLVPVVFAAVSVPLYVRRMRRHATGWRKLAADRELEAVVGEGLLAFFPMLWSLRGSIDGNAVEVCALVIRPGSRRRFTRASVQLGAAVPPGLSVRVERFSDKVARVFGAEDVQVGDPELDRRLVIRAPEPAHARAVLREPSVKKALCLLADAHPSFRVQDGAAFIDHASVESDPAVVGAELEGLVALARGMRAAS